VEEQARPNGQLIALMDRLGCTNSGLATRIRRLGESRGLHLRTDHVTVAKWRKGAAPRPDTVALITEVLSGMAGARVTPAMIGMDSGGSTGLGETPGLRAKSFVLIRWWFGGWARGRGRGGGGRGRV